MRATKATAPDGATVTNWRGRKSYECTRCAYSTLDAVKFADHWRYAHGSLERHAEEAPAFVEAPAPVTESLVED